MTHQNSERSAKVFRRFMELKPGPFSARTADEVIAQSYETFLACHRGDHGGLVNSMEWLGELRRWNLGAIEGPLGRFYLG